MAQPRFGVLSSTAAVTVYLDVTIDIYDCEPLESTVRTTVVPFLTARGHAVSMVEVFGTDVTCVRSSDVVKYAPSPPPPRPPPSAPPSPPPQPPSAPPSAPAPVEASNLGVIIAVGVSATLMLGLAFLFKKLKAEEKLKNKFPFLWKLLCFWKSWRAAEAKRKGLMLTYLDVSNLEADPSTINEPAGNVEEDKNTRLSLASPRDLPDSSVNQMPAFQSNKGILTMDMSAKKPTGEEWKRVDEEPGGYLDPEVAGVEALMEKLKEMRQKRPKSA